MLNVEGRGCVWYIFVGLCSGIFCRFVLPMNISCKYRHNLSSTLKEIEWRNGNASDSIPEDRVRFLLRSRFFGEFIKPFRQNESK